jgi:hypothetical protein
VNDFLHIIPGDLPLSNFENLLGDTWNIPRNLWAIESEVCIEDGKGKQSVDRMQLVEGSVRWEEAGVAGKSRLIPTDKYVRENEYRFTMRPASDFCDGKLAAMIAV